MSDLLPWMAPWTGLTVATLLLTTGLYLFWRGLFSDRSRGTPRCPKCWYDRTGLPSVTCPECGYALERDSDAHRTRRHWRLALNGFVLAIVLPTYAVQHRIRTEGWDYYLRLKPLYWIFPTRTVWSRQINGYSIECVRDQRDGYDGATFDGAVVRIRRGWHTVYQCKTAWHWDLAYDGQSITDGIDAGTDFNGDGIPDVAVAEDTDGIHGDYKLHVIELDPSKLKSLLIIDTHDSAAEFKWRNGLVDIELADWTFAYWNTCFTASPSPTVILSWNGKSYIPNIDAMRRPAPSLRELRFSANTIRASLSKSEATLDDNSQLWTVMLALIYTGHSELAYDFFDSAWPAERPRKEQFLADFKKQLNRSPYADALDAANHWR